MDIVKIKTTIKDEQKQNPSMKILPNIAQTIFYSLLFAIGGAPTIGMWIARIQTQNPDLILTAFIGLTVIIACVLVPVVLIQNSYLWSNATTCYSMIKSNHYRSFTLWWTYVVWPLGCTL